MRMRMRQVLLNAVKDEMIGRYHSLRSDMVSSAHLIVNCYDKLFVFSFMFQIM